MDALSRLTPHITPQREQADPRQAANNAGGFTFTVDNKVRLDRFLTLGVEGGTFYVREQNLAKENAKVVISMAMTDPQYLVERVLAISTAGRAPRQNPALFALAAACASPDDAGRAAALNALPKVARTGTHLFLFATYVEQFRGWGRGLRTAVADWYLDKNVEQLTYQLLKYQQREGWSHRDLLRLAHPAASTDAMDRLFQWAVKGELANTEGLALLQAYLAVQQAASVKRVCELIADHPLSWEMLPTQWLNERAVWEALLDNGRVPLGALVRQLPRLTRLDMLPDLPNPRAKGRRTEAVVAMLTDKEAIRKARLHPINLLVALRTYASGKSARGESTWSPSRKIVDALDAAFYMSFDVIPSTGKNFLLALDVSGSMGGAPIANMPLTAREASVAMAMATARTEENYEIIGFTSSMRQRSYGYGGHRPITQHEIARDLVDGVSKLDISPTMRMDTIVQRTSMLPFGGTDCALPMLYAAAKGLHVDVFVVYTDNETWAGQIHPHQALKEYRKRFNPQAKLIVVGMTATDFSIADPTDAGMLDIAGFDASVPNLIADFAGN